MVSRSLFLTFAALIAVGVGDAALLAPEVMLASKGIAGNAAARVWMQEVGAALIAVGVMAWLVRGHERPSHPASGLNPSTAGKGDPLGHRRNPSRHHRNLGQRPVRAARAASP